MSSLGVVYGLYHPRTGELRYVGQTWQTLQRRLNCHVSMARYKHQRHVVSWIKGVLAEGLRPDIRELGRASTQSALDALEIETISKIKTSGGRLTNHSVGGRGGEAPLPKREISTDFLIQILETGVSKRDLANNLGVSADFIYGRLKKEGLSFPEKRGPKVTPHG